ncbi:putative serine/threonine-protein kinase [Sesbania bispinosa]|nr:putative serine/threonine-protein kinase [Sesbania bispinosa]
MNERRKLHYVEQPVGEEVFEDYSKVEHNSGNEEQYNEIFQDEADGEGNNAVFDHDGNKESENVVFEDESNEEEQNLSLEDERSRERQNVVFEDDTEQMDFVSIKTQKEKARKQKRFCSKSLCYKEGERRNRGPTMEERTKEPRAETKSRCGAKFRVNVDKVYGRWYASCFEYEHSHELLDPIYCAMLASHRVMSDSDISQMNSMLNVGIGASHIFGVFTSQSGEYGKVGFKKKDIHNQILRQRKLQSSDVAKAIRFLCEFMKEDSMMYCEPTVDSEGRLEHLFWSDGISQLNYEILVKCLHLMLHMLEINYPEPANVFHNGIGVIPDLAIPPPLNMAEMHHVFVDKILIDKNVSSHNMTLPVVLCKCIPLNATNILLRDKYLTNFECRFRWATRRLNEGSASASTDSKNVGFSGTTSSAGRSQFSELASGSFGGGEGPFPLPSPNGQILERPNMKVFSYADLKSATKSFKSDTLLGEGGFGRVYKGWLDEKTLTPARAGSGMVVAIKKLNPESTQGFQEWQSEINFLGRLSHPNLVKLLGYCWDDEELLLVYEFMPKGSLENHLFRRNPNIEPLSWNTRIKIAIGAARGLAFLHTSEKVIYRDFKASNILLDGNYNAKISDFGLAKLGPSGGESHVTTRVMGTYGYAAPEYIATGHLYVKSDVYGFGVVLLEILTGMRALDTKRPTGQQNLVEWLKPCLSNKKKLKTIMDARIEGQYSPKAALQAAQLTLKCLEPDPKQRPSMKEVLEALEGIEAIKVKPKESKNLNSHQPQLHARQRVVKV